MAKAHGQRKAVTGVHVAISKPYEKLWRTFSSLTIDDDFPRSGLSSTAVCQKLADEWKRLHPADTSNNWNKFIKNRVEMLIPWLQNAATTLEEINTVVAALHLDGDNVKKFMATQFIKFDVARPAEAGAVVRDEQLDDVLQDAQPGAVVRDEQLDDDVPQNGGGFRFPGGVVDDQIGPDDLAAIYVAMQLDAQEQQQQQAGAAAAGNRRYQTRRGGRYEPAFPDFGSPEEGLDFILNERRRTQQPYLHSHEFDKFLDELKEFDPELMGEYQRKAGRYVFGLYN